MKKYVSTKKLLSDSFQLAFAGCQVIRQYHEKQINFKNYVKSNQDDLVTQADFKVQTIIMKGLSYNFPSLRIVGQENQLYNGELGYDFNNLLSNVLPSELKLEQDVNLQNLCAWIDPIDSTKSLVDGDLQNVSVLIGFSENNFAKLGIIGVPYFKYDGKLIYQPSIYIGSLSHKKSYEYRHNQTIKWKQITNKQMCHPDLQMVVSCSPFNRLEDIFQQKLQRKNMRVGGAGHRFLKVLRRQSSVAVYTPEWTSKWDICAAEAIVKAIGGQFSDGNGNKIVYDPSFKEVLNKQGIICTLDKQIYQNALSAYKQYFA